MMKAIKTTTVTMMVAGFLGACAWAPVYSAYQASGQTYTKPAAPPPGTQYQGAYTEPAPATAQAPSVQSPVGAAPAEKIMPEKKLQACARLDKDRDGYVSMSEFKASGKPAKVFKGADVGHRGKLNMEQCNKALTS
jgi:hypothetical protein